MLLLRHKLQDWSGRYLELFEHFLLVELVRGRESALLLVVILETVLRPAVGQLTLAYTRMCDDVAIAISD